MTPARIAWFTVGAVAGVYASVKARRAAYRLSMPGLIDQVGAVEAGWRVFSEELRTGMVYRERDILSSIDLDSVPAHDVDEPYDDVDPFDKDDYLR